MKKQFIVVLDISSDILSALAAELKRENFSIVALDSIESKGISNGNVEEINNAVKDIDVIIKRLGKKCKKRIKYISIIVKDPDIKMVVSRATVLLSRVPREIKKRDVDRCIQEASVANIPEDRAVVQRIVKEFHIDANPLPVKQPIGLYGIKLEAETYLATISRSRLDTITKCIDRAGYLIDTFCLSAVASSYSLLNETEKEEGAAIVDISDRFTELAVYRNGKLYNLTAFLSGYKDFTSRSYTLDRKHFHNFLDRLMDNAGKINKDISQIVLKGKGAMIDGVVEELEKYFSISTRIGIAREFSSYLTPEESLMHASTVGFCMQILSEKSDMIYRSPVTRYLQKIIDIYESYF